MKKSILLFIVMLGVMRAGYSQWTTSGTNIYNSNTGNVGINTTTPTQKLEVAGVGASNPNVMVVRNDNFPAVLGVYSNNSNASWQAALGLSRSRGTFASPLNCAPNDWLGSVATGVYYDNAYQTGASIEFYAGAGLSTSNYPTSMRFRTIATGQTTRSERMRIADNGFIGIGTTSPTSTLHVAGAVTIADGTQGLGKVLTSDANGLASWQPAGSSGGSGWALTGNFGTTDVTNFIGTTDSVPLTFKVNNTKAGRIDPTKQNTFFGYLAGSNTTTAPVLGTQNTAIGYQALQTNTNGAFNTAVGYQSLYNSTDQSNTAIGYASGSSNTGGFYNTYVGWGAGSGNANGFDNTFVGVSTGTTVDGISNSTAIGEAATVTASNQIRIGSQYVTSIGGQVGWTTLSDGRFKKNVKEDVAGLEFIKQLRPVSYVIDHTAYASFLGNAGTDAKKRGSQSPDLSTQTGFIAQEVEAVVKKNGYQFSGIVAPQNEKDNYGLRYGDFVVPLVKAIQELSAKVTAQQASIDSLTSKLNGNTALSVGLPQGSIQLFQNVPNPFSSETEIKMTIPDAVQQASVIVYNLQGAQLKTYSVTGHGSVSIKIQAGDLIAGMYIYALIANGSIIDTKKMILTR